MIEFIVLLPVRFVCWFFSYADDTEFNKAAQKVIDRMLKQHTI